MISMFLNRHSNILFKKMKLNIYFFLIISTIDKNIENIIL